MAGVLLWGYDATNEKWIPVLVDTEGKVKMVAVIDELDDIGDVNVPTPTDQQGIEWDETTGLWIVTSYMLSKLLTARGDIITRSATVPKRLALGTEGYYLKAGANEPEWASVVAGSLFVWKDESENALLLTNLTATIDWTDLDLTAYTSADAKAAFLKFRLKVDSITAGVTNYAFFRGRKNGTTPSVYFECKAFGGRELADMDVLMNVLIGLDTGQVIEYSLSISGTIQVDIRIDVLGYIE